MSYSFETIDSKVLTSTNKVNIPDWIDNIAFKKKVDRQFDLESNLNIINQKHVVASRDDNNLAFVREIKNSFDDKTLKTYAIVKLSSFLTKQRYAIHGSYIKNNYITFEITFDQNPAKYFFTFFVDDGKINNKEMFNVCLNDINEDYPFSIAGLEDSFEDVKNNFDKKNAYKVEKGNKQFTVMTRYEIVKRCNNSLKKASDLINQHLKEGNIVGVGSNEYASYYDMNYLFPDLREDYQKEASHTMDYVDNIGATKINEKKTAKRLAIETFPIMKRDFHVININSQKRNDNELIVNATISNNNIRKTANFKFDIINEKPSEIKSVVSDDQEYNLEDYKNIVGNISSKLNNKDDVRNEYIFSNISLNNQLNNIISLQHINELLNIWQNKQLITKLDEHKYASKYSLNELLDKSDVQFLSDEEVKNIIANKQYFGNNSRFYKSIINDNDTRNKIALYQQEDKLNNIINFISQYFNDFNLELLSDEDIIITFVVNDKPNNIYAKVSHNNDTVDNVICKIGNRDISIDKVKKYFSKSKLLKSYLKDNNVSQHNGIVISNAMIHNKLKDYLDKNTINTIIANLVNQKYLKHIGSNKYVSKLSFDELINLCNETPNEDLKNENLKLSSKTDRYNIDKVLVQDSDTRNSLFTQELKGVADFISQYLNQHKNDIEIDIDKLVELCNDFLTKQTTEVTPEIASEIKQYIFDRICVRDNDTRNQIALYQQEDKLNNIIDFISQYFNDFNLELLSDEDIVIMFVIDNKPNNIYAKISYDNNKINDVICKVGHKNISVKNLKKCFAKSNLLKSYLSDNTSSKHSNIIISNAMIHNKLKNYLNKDTIQVIINNLINQKYLKHISSNKYVSNLSFDELINLCNETPIEDLKDRNLKLSSKTDQYSIDNVYLQDNDTRNYIVYANLENYAYNLHNYIKNYFEQFTMKLIDKYHIDLNLCGKEVYATVILDNDNIQDVVCDINNKKISISKFQDVLKQSDLLRAYLEDNDESKHNGFIISDKLLHKKLSNYLSDDSIDDLIQYLINNQLLKQISSCQYASKFNMDNMLREIDIHPDMNLKQLKLTLSNRFAQQKFDKVSVKDSDNRKLIKSLKKSDYVTYINSVLPKNIILNKVSNIQYKNDVITSDLSLFNEDKGLSSTVHCSANVDNANIKNIKYYYNDKEIDLNNIFASTTLTKEIDKISKHKHLNKSIIFNKNDLKEQLKYLTDEQLLDDVIAAWQAQGKVKIIDSNNFASQSTLNELIAASNLKPYQSDVTKRKFLQATRQKEIIPKGYHTDNFTVKSIDTIKDGKTHDRFDKVKNDILTLAHSYCDKQIITSKKLDKIKQLLGSVKNVNQLDTIYQDLQRYAK